MKITVNGKKIIFRILHAEAAIKRSGAISVLVTMVAPEKLNEYEMEKLEDSIVSRLGEVQE